MISCHLTERNSHHIWDLACKRCSLVFLSRHLRVLPDDLFLERSSCFVCWEISNLRSIHSSLFVERLPVDGDASRQVLSHTFSCISPSLNSKNASSIGEGDLLSETSKSTLIAQPEFVGMSLNQPQNGSYLEKPLVKIESATMGQSQHKHCPLGMMAMFKDMNCCHVVVVIVVVLLVVVR